MIYVKGTLPTGEVVAVPLKDNGFFCHCPVCKQETHIDYDIFCNIVEEGELEESEVYCDPCGENYRNGKVKRNLTVIK
jgi:C4-type Zn-finger protein